MKMEEGDMDTSPSYFDPEVTNTRERYRRYGYGFHPDSCHVY